MRRFALVCALTVLGLPAGAMAEDGAAPEKAAVRAGARELTGKVLQANDDELVIEFRGLAVPFRVVADTRLQGATAVKEIEEGSQVRASYELKRNQNRLRSLTVLPGEGTADRKAQDRQGEASPGR